MEEPLTEPRKACVICGHASDTTYNRITVEKGRRKTEGPFCQKCWDKQKEKQSE